jgi:hypothetical protein
LATAAWCRHRFGRPLAGGQSQRYSRRTLAEQIGPHRHQGRCRTHEGPSLASKFNLHKAVPTSTATIKSCAVSSINLHAACKALRQTMSRWPAGPDASLPATCGPPSVCARNLMCQKQKAHGIKPAMFQQMDVDCSCKHTTKVLKPPTMWRGPQLLLLLPPLPLLRLRHKGAVYGAQEARAGALWRCLLRCSDAPEEVANRALHDRACAPLKSLRRGRPPSSLSAGARAACS